MIDQSFKNLRWSVFSPPQGSICYFKQKYFTPKVQAI